jgi:hypothetical protein
LEIKQQQQLIGGRKIEKPRLMRADGGQGLNRLIGGRKIKKPKLMCADGETGVSVCDGISLPRWMKGGNNSPRP